MQRFRLAVATVLATSACSDPCPGPDQINGALYQGFSTVRVFGEQSDEAEEREGFPSLGSPANGSHTWEVRWGGANNGPIELLIDAQAFEGTGAWDLVNCGTFTLSIPENTYLDEDGNRHLFVLNGSFMAYASRLEGSLFWAEAWETADGTAEGDFVAESVQLRGTIPL